MLGFKFLGKILGSEKALDGMVKGVSSALDSLVYTDEEKANDAAKDRSEARGMVVAWMKATQGQNLARRFLALIITAVWLLQYLSSLSLDLYAVSLEKPDRIIEASAVIGDRAEGMNGAMMLIIGFYFAAPYMGDIAEVALKKFGNISKK